MGTIHAKEPDGSVMEESKKTFDLQNLPAKVQRVVVDGLGRTKDDLIVKEVQPIFEAKTFEDVSLKFSGVVFSLLLQ
ncbi:hypothetical protein SNE40_003003 [Patella caerulea]|uniref:Uncharacterized protein n=1 Tax=Patella caerulea TaxID=87958 RepID=A0AAN8K767_PATCE